MKMRFSPSALIAAMFSQGKLAVRSSSAARGAILSRASARTLSSRIRSSSDSAIAPSSLSKIRTVAPVPLLIDALRTVDDDGLASEERQILVEQGGYQPRHLV